MGRAGSAEGEGEGLWQEGKNVGVIQPQSKNTDHCLPLLSPELPPSSTRRSDEKSQAEFVCGCPVEDFMEIQLYLTN